MGFERNAEIWFSPGIPFLLRNHYEALKMNLPDRYEPQFGFWRSYVPDAI